jgi:hypothetical protein
MSSRENVTVFDDGSLESKVLQFELKTSYDVNVVTVKADQKLDLWLAEVIDETDEIQKIFLHFPSEDYITTDLRDQVNIANHNYPLLRIVPWYEKTSRDSINRRAINYGVKLEAPKTQVEVKGGIDPDDEMKALEPEKKKYKAPYKKRYRVA